MVQSIRSKALNLGLVATLGASGCTNYDLSFKTSHNGEETVIQAPKNDLARSLPSNWDNIVDTPFAQEINYDNGASTRRVTSVIGDNLELGRPLEYACSKQEEDGGMYGDIFGGSFSEPIITIDYIRHEEESSNNFVIAYSQDYCNSNPIIIGWFNYQGDVPLRRPDYVGLNFSESSLEKIITEDLFSMNNFQNVSPNRINSSLLGGNGEETSAMYTTMMENISGYGDRLIDDENFKYVQR